MEKITVLYAEDDRMTVLEVREKLEEEGFEVIVAKNGNEALELYKRYHPEVIVLDVEMPGRNGLEVLKFIRLTDSRTPIIIYSCYVEEERQIKGLKWGANVYLLKNYTPSLLVAQVRRCVLDSTDEIVRLSPEVSYDFTNSNIEVGGETRHLTMLESRVFSLLCKNRNTLVLREDLLEAGWHNDAPSCQLQLNKLMTRFREILKTAAPHVRLVTDKTNGYWLKTSRQ